MLPLQVARRITAGAAIIAGCATADAGEPAGGAGILVFAATSTTEAITEAAATFQEETGIVVTSSFASSSTLARQIEQGAPAQIFVSASESWMDYLDARELMVAGTRARLFGNGLVLVAPADSPLQGVEVSADLDLTGMLAGGRLALGDPDHVPAGQYARAALESLGLWREAEPRLARQNTVRSALALVVRGEVPLGIVYATDAAGVDGVKIVGTFPAGIDLPISYPAALVQDTPAARQFLAFLHSESARAIFARHGFVVD
ncbi:MAG: molybdate ABC transporter substrate-binding protein [Candidatus Krumholzibacteriia bacterium]